MADTTHAIAEKICVFSNDVKAKDNGECQNENIFDGRLTVIIKGFHTLMVT